LLFHRFRILTDQKDQTKTESEDADKANEKLEEVAIEGVNHEFGFRGFGT
jgi:hypothetical protein